MIISDKDMIELTPARIKQSVIALKHQYPIYTHQFDTEHPIIKKIITATISAIKLAKAEEGFSYISKGGGAFLEWLEGKGSPGVNALEENKIN